MFKIKITFNVKEAQQGKVYVSYFDPWWQQDHEDFYNIEDIKMIIDNLRKYGERYEKRLRK